MIDPPSAARWPAGRPYWPLLLPLLLATMTTAACSIRPAAGPGGDAPGSPSSPSRTPASAIVASPSAASAASTPATGETPITITLADTVITARLTDNATARDLAAQLPLTLRFSDHNGVEKTAPLPNELSTEGAPDAHDPVAGDLGYFAPGGDLVLYHDDEAPEFPGIVRIGRLNDDLDALARQDDEFEATVDSADDPTAQSAQRTTEQQAGSC